MGRCGLACLLLLVSCAAPSGESSPRAGREGADGELRSRPGAIRAGAASPDRGGAGDPATDADPRVQRGLASWYGGRFHGLETASGERFDKRALTAAHRELPFGTVVRVENLDNGRSVRVRINDRGPFGKRERIIDVSEAAARQLDMIQRGVVPVLVEVVERPDPAGERRDAADERREKK